MNVLLVLAAIFVAWQAFTGGTLVVAACAVAWAAGWVLGALEFTLYKTGKKTLAALAHFWTFRTLREWLNAD